MDAIKTEFLKILAESYGIVASACVRTKISRQTYYNWRSVDPEFKEAADEIMEVQKDFVESKLLKNIDNGDTTAIIFYCKTKLKDRGYSEKALPIVQQHALPGCSHKALSEGAPEREKETKSRVAKRRAGVVKMLKKLGRYSPDLDLQIDLLASLLVKLDDLRSVVLSSEHSPLNVEISREGNRRENVSELERLYMEYSRLAQQALRATGLNKDSKDKPESEDKLATFMDDING